MDKTAIKNFSIWARKALIRSVADKCGLVGVREDGIQEPLPQSTRDMQFFDAGTGAPASISGDEIKKRKALVQAIHDKQRDSDYKTAYNFIVEQIAYTWFNRLIAIRFMEVNDYLPSRIRVLSSEQEGKLEPDILSTPFDAEFDFTPQERDTVIQWKDRGQKEDMDALFRLLFVKQCDALHEILPNLFQKVDGHDYTELLLNISFTDRDGVVYRLVNDIPEDNFSFEQNGQVESIGWAYQYYNEDRKNEVINIYKGTVKKDDIPAATQLFTTDWVVRYMVDNSLGRYWIERHPESKLAEKLEFFVTPKNGEVNHIDEFVKPEDVKFLDPCMGSGHILVYAFDVLMEIYKESGYTERDAAAMIVQNNLFGLDIDDRASQLAYFAVMMKARSYDRRFLSRGIKPNVLAIKESNGMGAAVRDGLTTDAEMNAISRYLVDSFRDAKELGSIITVEPKDYDGYMEYLDNCDGEGQLTMEDADWLQNTRPMLKALARQAKVLAAKYPVVCTNPPYLNKIEGRLKTFVTENYKDYSGDLFSVFTYRNLMFCKQDGYCGYMTPFVWMFIKTYEKLREFIIRSKSITTLVQMEYSAFEEATVPICSFVLKNGKTVENGLYFKLSDFKGGMDVQKQKILEALADKNCGYFYEADQSNFSKIPGSPVAYWVSNAVIAVYNKAKLLGDIASPRTGMTTGDNNRFLRLWSEIEISKAKFDAKDASDAAHSEKKWFPYCKGGGYMRWYGYNEYLVNWENDGFEIKNNIKPNGLKAASVRSESLYFKKLITWSAVTSGSFSCRLCEGGSLFDSGGSSIDVHGETLYILAILNSAIGQFYLDISNATINYQPGDIAGIPVVFPDGNEPTQQIEECVQIAHEDWDSFETSWDFKRNPLAIGNSLSAAYAAWKQECEDRFQQLKQNEEELNRIFIDIYGLQDELTPDVADKDITVHRVFDSKDDVPESMKGSNYVRTMRDEIVSLISYAVGCMFGRYSLDVDGLAYAGGEWDASKYITFIPDEDNCIPVTDVEYFDDDIVGRFVEFVRTVYGEDTLEENLRFVADALGGKGTTSREIIRNYFLNDFIKDHIKTYQKRPIYWMFDSGKQNGFKALIYMHRYDENTIGRIRADYLFKMQRAYENELKRTQDTIDSSTNAREVAQAEKRKEKLTKQLKETRDYDQKIAHLALARISIDLDDGVKVNYEKIQTAPDGKKLAILTAIK